MTQFRNAAVLTALFLILLPVALIAEDRDENYAKYLFSNGYYDEAARTYLYLQYSSSDAAKKNTFSYWMGRSYFEKRDFSAAEKNFKPLISRTDFAALSHYDIYFDYLRSIYFQKRFYEVSFEIENGKYSSDSDRIAELNGWCAINTSDWSKAAEIFNRLSTNGKEQDRARLKAISDGINGYPAGTEKSPMMAGILSAILPGAGHLYAGNLTNAIGAFMLNAIFGSLTAYSVHKKQWGYAAFFGFMEVGWYTGNIASAYQEAKYRNTRDDNERKMSLSAQFPFKTGN